jgi:hypothetical protein
MHAWYYDQTPDKKYSDDPEGNLVWVCDRCARDLRLEVEFAGTDVDKDAPCDICNHAVGD